MARLPGERRTENALTRLLLDSFPEHRLTCAVLVRYRLAARRPSARPTSNQAVDRDWPAPAVGVYPAALTSCEYAYRAFLGERI